MKTRVGGQEIEVPDEIFEGLSRITTDAEERGFRRGVEHGRAVANQFDEREVFILPAHSTLGNWQIELCQWGPFDNQVRMSPENPYFQTEEDARRFAVENGYVISDKPPHCPGARRQHIRPPYSW